MKANSGEPLQMRIGRPSKSAAPTTEDQVWIEKIRRFAILVFSLNMISAAMFIGLVNRPVYDDPFNIFDVHNYAARGLSVNTLLSQRNPPGPTSFLWMAAGVRLLRGGELRDARIAALSSWILLAAGVLVASRFSRFAHLWYGCLLSLLVFPHAIEAAATVLTEGPALLFALMGVLAWTEFASSPNLSAGNLGLGLVGGLSLGLAVTCRQYYLALLPAGVFFAFYQWRAYSWKEKPRWVGGVVLSLALATVPVLLLALIWKGISTPGMAAGTSYPNLKAAVGLNLSRPIVVAFYAAVYLVPITFPAMIQLRGSRRRLALLLAVFGGAAVTPFSSLFLQPGPLNSLIRFASRLPQGGTALFAVIAMVAVYNATSVCALLWEQRQVISSCVPAVFALLVIVFFVAEQVGVGGNLPFYDRYVLQLAPFLGLIAFTVLPRLTPARGFAFAGLSALSHIMLWRFAFNG
jgi:hypothetical protein